MGQLELEVQRMGTRTSPGQDAFLVEDDAVSKRLVQAVSSVS